MNSYTFKTTINCMNCVRTVTPILNELDNIESWHVDTDNADKVLHVSLDDENVNAVIAAVKTSGFEIEQF
ncbi:MAG: cation transporter [Bacteroidetes bacterium]|jgi:copper chaperone|nr:cation transporter [Bacteroidota bacterium]